MFVVALKRAGFAVSWSRTASWEIPTKENEKGVHHFLSKILMARGSLDLGVGMKLK
jgi:hypothetical protein